MCRPFSDLLVLHAGQHIGDEVLTILCFCLSYPFLCGLSLVCNAGPVQSALGSSLEEIALSVGIDLTAFMGGGEFRVFIHHLLGPKAQYCVFTLSGIERT